MAQESILHKIFGQDLDVFVESHVAAYEDAKKKWAACSTEEWTAGADGNIVLEYLK